MLWELAFYINNLWFTFGSIYWFTQHMQDCKLPLVRYRWTAWRDDYTTQFKEGSRNIFISTMRILRKVKEQWHVKSRMQINLHSPAQRLANLPPWTLQVWSTPKKHTLLCLSDLPQPAFLPRTGCKKFFCSSLCESLCLTISCIFQKLLK